MQSPTMSPRTFFIALACFVIALLAVSGCGGGSDASAPVSAAPPAPAARWNVRPCGSCARPAAICRNIAP